MKREAFIAAVQESEKTMYHVAMSILKNDSDCADAVQQALMVAFEKLHTLKQERFFKTWLIRILINECYRIQRYQKKHMPYEECIMASKEWHQDNYTDLYLAIMELPEKLRVLVTLYYLDGYSVKETAAIMEMNEGTVKSRLSKARQMLKLQLDGAEPVLCQKNGEEKVLC